METGHKPFDDLPLGTRFGLAYLDGPIYSIYTKVRPFLKDGATYSVFHESPINGDGFESNRSFLPYAKLRAIVVVK